MCMYMYYVNNAPVLDRYSVHVSESIYLNTFSIFVQTASDKNSAVFLWLQDEKNFRDKLSSIYVALNFSLDPKAAADSHGLRPILNYQTTNVIEQKVF